MHIDLPPEYEQMIQEKIAAGLFANSTEVVLDALRLQEQMNQRLEELRRELRVGEEQIERGEVQDALEFIRDLKSQYAR